MLNGLSEDLHLVEFSGDLQHLRQRQVTPGTWFAAVCDGKFFDEDLNNEGIGFAEYYYGDTEPNYFSDLESAIGDRLPTPYHLPDTWDVYDQLAPLLRFRFDTWKQSYK